MNPTTYLPPRKKHIIITGHYGSGKTHIAVNLALFLKKTGAAVTLIDLDTVNPYFRAADSQSLLQKNGVRCILPQYANTNVDLPSLPAEIHSVFSRNTGSESPDEYAIFDVGGDNGAVALGAYSARLKNEGYEMLYVVNRHRPLTAEPAEAVEILREIEGWSRLSHTAIVNNSNLGDLTTPELIADSLPYAKAVCNQSGLPLAFTASMTESDPPSLPKDVPLFPLRKVTKRIF